MFEQRQTHSVVDFFCSFRISYPKDKDKNN